MKSFLTSLSVLRSNIQVHAASCAWAKAQQPYVLLAIHRISRSPSWKALPRVSRKGVDGVQKGEQIQGWRTVGLQWNHLGFMLCGARLSYKWVISQGRLADPCISGTVQSWQQHAGFVQCKGCQVRCRTKEAYWEHEHTSKHVPSYQDVNLLREKRKKKKKVKEVQWHQQLPQRHQQQKSHFSSALSSCCLVKVSKESNSCEKTSSWNK